MEQTIAEAGTVSRLIVVIIVRGVGEKLASAVIGVALDTVVFVNLQRQDLDLPVSLLIETPGFVSVYSRLRELGGLMAPDGQPAFVLYVQTFGDPVTFNPHIHALVADGVFLPTGTFRVLPPLPEAALREALRHKVLHFLCSEGVLDTGLTERMLKWRHSGFSVHNRVRTKAVDAKGRQRLARYMISCPFSLEKMRYDKESG